MQQQSPFSYIRGFQNAVCSIPKNVPSGITGPTCHLLSSHPIFMDCDLLGSCWCCWSPQKSALWFPSGNLSCPRWVTMKTGCEDRSGTLRFHHYHTTTKEIFFFHVPNSAHMPQFRSPNPRWIRVLLVWGLKSTSLAASLSLFRCKMCFSLTTDNIKIQIRVKLSLKSEYTIITPFLSQAV